MEPKSDDVVFRLTPEQATRNRSALEKAISKAEDPADRIRLRSILQRLEHAIETHRALRGGPES